MNRRLLKTPAGDLTGRGSATIRTEFACGLPRGHAEGICRERPGVQVLAAERGFHLLEFGVILPSRHGEELKARTRPAGGVAAQVLLASRTADVDAACRVEPRPRLREPRPP